MHIIPSLPNYIFTSCAAIQTYCLTNKIFDNITETNKQNNFYKDGLLIIIKSVLIISTAALTTQYPIAVTISLVAIHLLFPKNNTCSPKDVSVVEEDIKTKDKDIETSVRDIETSVRDIDISICYFENQLSTFSRSNEFKQLPPNIANIIKALSKKISSLKQKETLDYCDVENRLSPDIKELFNSQILKNFHSNIKNWSYHDLKEDITLNLPIVKILMSFTEFQKKQSSFKKLYLDDLLKLMNKINQESKTYVVPVMVNGLIAHLFKGKIQQLDDAKDDKVNDSQSKHQLPNFLEEFIYSNTSQVLTRKNIANEILINLNKKELKNIILIGKAGSGKTTILESMAAQISNKPRFKNLVFYKLDATALIGGTVYVGEQEGRIQHMKEFFKSLKEEDTDRQIVVIIDEIHQLTGMGATMNCNNDVWQALKEDLGNSKFTIIGTTTEEEYQTHIKSDTAVASRFSTITVPELSKTEYNQIINIKADECISQYNLKDIITREDLIKRVKQKTSSESMINTRELIHCMQRICSELDLESNEELF